MNTPIEGFVDPKDTSDVAYRTAHQKCCGCDEKLGFNVTLVCVEVGEGKWDIYHKGCWQG
jgi:hypothetical protein